MPHILGERHIWGDHLKVDIQRIRESGNTVRQISREFAQADGLVESRAGDIGSTDLASSLHEFATNWKVHRERLCGDLDTFADWAIRAADAYEKSDRDLARVLSDGAK